ncbi:MAG: o-succinylbenzoate--CoA ligase [Cystobacterineae bacterium]|nr:o-succinylbenzoate--CoA ligase [Cystobacterineae bacterium]MCL2258926.1 o-succinylbenzoate--CoA ligase [Cystobacterineae bacterium]
MQCLVEQWARRRPKAIALRFEGKAWTWEELNTWVGAWVRELSTRGIEAGEGIGVLAFNQPDTVALFHACARLGARLVLLNARLAKNELSLLEQLSLPKFCFIEAPLLEKFPRGEVFPRLAPPSPPTTASHYAEENVAATLFTSGTTGTPKRIDIRHRHLLAHATASAANLGGETQHIWYVCLPLFHIGGLVHLSRCALYGATLSLAQKFEVAFLDAEVEAGRVSHLSLVPTMLSQWLEYRGGKPIPMGMEVCLVGGAHVPLPLFLRARQMGIPILCTYGLTEACSQVATEERQRADGESCGFPLPGVEVRICKEGAREAGEGEVGEIEVRGETVLIGEGWQKTGDFGYKDNRGRLVVLSRRVDLIISGGENIYPSEIERVLLQYPGIKEAAIGACASERWGQVPIALVVFEGLFIEEALLQHCREQLAGYKIPKAIFAVDVLPKNASGKVDRQKLRELIASLHF